MQYDPKVEEFVRANGKVYKRNNVDVIRMDLDTEHFYYLGKIGWVPSVTSILDQAAPVGFGLRQFWKANTAEESDQILRAAGEFGTKLHGAFEDLIAGTELDLLQNFQDFREKKAIVRFGHWFDTFRPINYESEQVVASAKYSYRGIPLFYAGTLDFIGQVKRKDAVQALGLTNSAAEKFINRRPNKLETWIVDFKTSRALHYSHELQLAAYKQAVLESFDIKVDRMGLLRLPSQHKVGYEFKEVTRSTKDFMNVYATYLNLHNGKIPYPKELEVYPAKFKLITEVKET